MSITPITYQVSGAAWQKVWARIPGSTLGAAVGQTTVPEVPQLATTAPGATAPTPTAPQALSAPPPTIGVPAVRPVAAAARAETVPSTSVEPPTSGSSDGASSIASSISRLQRRFATSSSSVPDASEYSVASVPESCSRM